MEATLAHLKKSRESSKGHLTKAGLTLNTVMKTETTQLRRANILSHVAALDKQLLTHQHTFDLTIKAAELDGDNLSQLKKLQYEEYEEELDMSVNKIEEFKASYTEQLLRLDLCNELYTLNETLSYVTIRTAAEGRSASARVETPAEQFLQITREHPELLRTDKHLEKLRQSIAGQLEKIRYQIPEEVSATAPVSPLVGTGSWSRLPYSDRYHNRRGLPKLDIPTFTGNIHNFPHWWKQFNKFVHQDAEFDESDKLSYLKQTFKTNDMIILDGQGAGPGLYDTYIREIKTTYDRPRVVHRDYTNEIFTKSPMTNDSISQLKELYATFNNAVLKLEATGQYDADSLLTSRLELLMTPKLRGKWKEHTTDQRHVPPIKEALAFLLARKQAYDDVDDLTEEPAPVRVKPVRRERYPEEEPAPVRVKPVRRERHRDNSGSSQQYRESFPIQTGTWPPCRLCKTDTHPLYTCPIYLAYNPKGRADYAQDSQLCINCLSRNHEVDACRNVYRCKECKEKHHTTLHVSDTSAATVSRRPTSDVAINYTTTHSFQQLQKGVSISPTLELLVHGTDENETTVLALFDTGSSVSLVTDDVVTRMGLVKHASNTRIMGVEGASRQRTAPTVSLTITSAHCQGTQLKTTAFVVATISGKQERPTIDYQWDPLKRLALANPNFRKPQTLDVLLGNDVLGRIEMTTPILKDYTTGVTIRNTIFGWVVNGSTTSTQRDELINQSEPYICTTTGAEVNPDLLAEQQRTTECIQQFATSEEMPEEPTSSMDDAAALMHYDKTHQILDNGRFQVALPRPVNGPELGLSRSQAARRFMSNERSLCRKGGWKAFQAVVAEYMELGHAERVPAADLGKPPAEHFYLPMHAVYKESSTSPLRVVFDASADTSTGTSLNDTLLTGPTVYPSLTDILVRFRLHRIAITADISKMFRAISLDPCDRDFHRFLWRALPNDSLLDYRMTRVTFGVSCSPFLATQTLQNIADRVAETHPLAAAALHTAFYVDDCITGTDTEAQAMQLQREVQEVLQRHQLKIKKWRSNSPVVLGTISEDLQEREPTHKPYGPQQHLKTLGIHWDAKRDTFQVSTSKLELTRVVTKRTLASDVAQTFDVLGWFSPTTILMKILIQELWRGKLGVGRASRRTHPGAVGDVEDGTSQLG